MVRFPGSHLLGDRRLNSARSLLLANLFTDESPNSIAKPPGSDRSRTVPACVPRSGRSGRCVEPPGPRGALSRIEDSASAGLATRETPLIDWPLREAPAGEAVLEWASADRINDAQSIHSVFHQNNCIALSATGGDRVHSGDAVVQGRGPSAPRPAAVGLRYALTPVVTDASRCGGDFTSIVNPGPPTDVTTLSWLWSQPIRTKGRGDSPPTPRKPLSPRGGGGRVETRPRTVRSSSTLIYTKSSNLSGFTNRVIGEAGRVRRANPNRSHHHPGSAISELLGRRGQCGDTW